MYIYGYTNVFRTIYTSSTPPVDPDAQAFITAAAITDPTQQSAVNQLVVDLKGYGVWTKMKALYPFVGGTASQHKFNLKNPLDTDAAFRLVFNGGWTHSVNGALPNGTNGYADTYFIPSTNFTSLNNKSFGNYIGTNTNNGVDMGSLSSTYFGDQLISRTSNICLTSNSNQFAFTPASLDSRGFWLSSRILSTQAKLYKNNSVVATEGSSVSQHNSSFVLGARKYNVSDIQSYTDKRFQFASLGDGLTDTESANFYTAVQTFQTTLSRNI
jgi:hypothetical protein